MSSFGDGNVKTRIEQELSWIAAEYYAENLNDNKEAKIQFMLDVMEVLQYICEEY